MAGSVAQVRAAQAVLRMPWSSTVQNLCWMGAIRHGPLEKVAKPGPGAKRVSPPCKRQAAQQELPMQS